MAHIIAQGSFLAYGLSSFTKSAFESASSSKNWEDISSVDLSKRSFLITGANSGLGLSASQYFASRGGTVHMVCRNKDKGEAAVKQVKENSGNDKVFLHLCDVSRPDQIRNCVKDFENAGYTLDVLVNNAGVMLDKREETPDGLDTTFATNTISTFLFTALFLPTLVKGQSPRVIIISSGGGLTEKLLIKEKYEKYKTQWNGRTAYARTKRHQLALCERFAEKFSKTGVLFVAMHPGWADTPAVKTSMPDFYEKFKNKLRTPEQGADTILWLGATNSLTEKDNGEFFRDRSHEIKHFHLAATRYKPNAIDSLWNWCCEVTKWSEDELKGKLGKSAS